MTLRATTAAVVGAGAAGLLHALSHRAHGVPVVAIFDPDAARAKDLAAMCGAEALSSIDALARLAVDCVSVCSPPRFHVEQASLCAREGRVVFVEKPVAVTAGELSLLARLPGCVPIVQWRAGRAIRAVRRAVAMGELGDRPSVSIDLAWHRDEAYFRAGRSTNAEWGCGALLSVGIHAVDAACFAIDRPIDDVMGLRSPRSNAGDIEGSSAFVAQFSGGALVSLRITFDGGPDATRLSFCGGGVTATISGSEVDPTASEVAWSCEDPEKLARLVELEHTTDGHVQAPLIVPFLGRALHAHRRGMRAGECDALPDIDAVVTAHDAILRLDRSRTTESSMTRKAS